jgi:hypothetical protein
MTRTQRGWMGAVQAALFLLALGVAVPSAAQTEMGPRLWTAVAVQGRAGASPWLWAADTFVRTRHGVGAMDVAGGRVSVSRNLTRRSSAGMSYAFGAAFPDAGSLREHRFAQQFAWSAGVGRRISFRTRVEERFVTGQDAMMLRLREQVRATWPLGAKGALRGVVSDEVLVRVNSMALAARGFDSNRLFVGVGRAVTAHSIVEIGYMNVYSPGTSSRAHGSHVMSATLVVLLQ